MSDGNRRKRFLPPEQNPDSHNWRGSQHDESLSPLREILACYLSAASQISAVCVGDARTDGGFRVETKEIDKPVDGVVASLISAAVGSGGTLLRLSESFGWHTRDSYGIVRSIVELCVNASYILAEGPQAAEQAQRHAGQRTYRDGERASEIGGNVIRLGVRGRPLASEVEGLESALAEFTSKKGRQKSWTDLSVEQRIEAVGRLDLRAMESLQWAYFAVYADSSEFLHGSFFGVQRFLGITLASTPKDQSELLDDVAVQHLGLLMYAAMAFGGLVRAFDAKYGFKWAMELEEAMLSEMRDVPWLRRGAKNETQEA